MKNVLVTGSSGFIGSALTKKLKRRQYNVIEINSTKHNINNINTFLALQKEEIDYIFHLAAKTYIPQSWEKPSEYYETNTMGTKNILEFCRTRDIPMTFFSAYIYGQPELLPISEDAPVKPNNPYAHSKYLAEQLCCFYATHYNLKVNIIRPFNVFGPGQNKNFLIPNIINQALHNDTIEVQTLLPKRDYIYLDDLVEAAILLKDSNGDNETYNIGSGFSISVKKVIQTIQDALSTKKPVISKNTERKNEIYNVISDITKAETRLKWKPEHSFLEGIHKTLKR